MDIQNSRSATRRGAMAVTSIALAKAALAYAMYGNGGEAVSYWNDPTELADTAILLVFAVAILRHSRLAALGLIIYVVTIKLAIALVNNNFVEVGLGLVLLPFSVQALRGALAYHPNRRKEDSTYRATRTWHYVVGIPSTLVFIGFLTFAVAFEFGIIPPTGLTSGEDLPKGVQKSLINKGVVGPDENIILYYSAGLFSYNADGNVLTDQRIVSYFLDNDDDLMMDWAYLSEIEDVEIIDETTPEGQGILKVTTDYGDHFVLYLPADEDAQLLFLLQMGVQMSLTLADEKASGDADATSEPGSIRSEDQAPE